MFFMLSADRQGRLEIASDSGHRFSFDVIATGQTRRVTIKDASWGSEQQPDSAFRILRHALRFASTCARDHGLA